MPRLSLPSVTLFCVDCVDLKRALAVIDRCTALCDFGDVKFLTSLKTDRPHIEIQPLRTLVEVSLFMLKKSAGYVNTPHFLTVQHDGWILNTGSWDFTWLRYDYVAPVFNQNAIVGAGGFSLRSHRLMSRVAELTPAWDGSNTADVQERLGCYEDGVISWGSVHDTLLRQGFRFAPVSESVIFGASGNPGQEFYHAHPFGFHRPPRRVNLLEGTIDPEFTRFTLNPADWETSLGS